jgi:hypothetical protein
MTFYSDPKNVAEQTEYQGRTVAVMNVDAGESCGDCGGLDSTPDEENCSGCNKKLTHQTKYVVLIDDDRQNGFHDSIEQAMVSAKKYIDGLEAAAKAAPPPLQLAGQTSATDAVKTGASSYDAATITKITAQGAILGWGVQLAALCGMKAAESNNRPRLPGPRH